MKKVYIIPQIDYVDMKVSAIMTTASREQIEENVGSGSAEPGSPNLSGANRGEWGNLWKK